MEGFGELVSREHWTRLVSTGGIRRFPAGRALMGQGENGDHVFLLTSGRVRISRLEPDGERLVLAVRRAPEILGELGLYGGGSRTATVTAIDPCTAVQLEGDRFRVLVAKLGLEALLMRHLTSRLRESEDLRAELSLLPAGPRVARFLHRLASSARMAEGTEIDLGLGQTDLADAVGLSRQTVAMEIAFLRNEGIIRTGRNRIVVISITGLKERTEQ